VGLPFILSYALGYKFNPRTLKFTKTGLIFLKTQPQGASIYLNNRLLSDKTPITLHELLPGNYNTRVELENHYPWHGEVSVEAGKVTRLDKIILFPLRPNMKQLNKDKISGFWVDQGNGRIYYFNEEERVIYRSNLDGDDFEMIGTLPQMYGLPKEWKISLDKEKLMCFNQHQIAIVYLNSKGASSDTEPRIVLDYPNRTIIEVFWHSDSYHLVLVTDATIEVLEARYRAVPVVLVNLNKENIGAFYDDKKDALYFIDRQQAADGNFYDNVYELELSGKNFVFKDLLKPRPANE
jgi:hypothetical protein